MYTSNSNFNFGRGDTIFTYNLYITSRLRNNHVHGIVETVTASIVHIAKIYMYLMHDVDTSTKNQ